MLHQEFCDSIFFKVIIHLIRGNVGEILECNSLQK